MGKRGNGEGSIYQDRKTGRWIAQATVQGKRKSLYGKTQREARDKLRAMLADLDHGILPPAERLTVAQYLERWLTDVVKPGVRRATYLDYCNAVRRHATPAFGRVLLAQLQPAHLQALYATMLERGLSPKTVRNVHGALHRALEQAVRWSLVGRNVAAIARPPKAKRKEIEAFDPSSVRALLAQARGTRWEALMTVAIATGMRQGELLGLKWADVDLEAGSLAVRRQLNRDLTFSEPKTAAGRRRIDLPASTVAVLREHKVKQNEARLSTGPDWEASDLVFTTWRGRALNHRNVYREYTMLLERAQLPHAPFHALRHTAATLLFSQGVPAKVIQERLGHSTIAMTMDIYSHVLPGMGRAAAQSLDAMLA